MIGGFIMPDRRHCRDRRRDVTRLGPERRPTNMVFQGYGLFPHMNVRQNIAYGLKIAERPRGGDRPAGRRHACAGASRRHLPTASIQDLSGGQQQRVALARALVMRPQVLLLDEPLAALDLKLRQAMQEELRRIHREIGGTFVFVTHDQGEALALANRIAVMEAGELVQQGDAEEIYARPRTRFVSTFIGEANIFEGRASATGRGVRRRARSQRLGPDGRVTVVVRPEDVRLAPPRPRADVAFEGVLEDMVYLGAFVRYRLRAVRRTAASRRQARRSRHPDGASRRQTGLGRLVARRPAADRGIALGERGRCADDAGVGTQGGA